MMMMMMKRGGIGPVTVTLVRCSTEPARPACLTTLIPLRLRLPDGGGSAPAGTAYGRFDGADPWHAGVAGGWGAGADFPPPSAATPPSGGVRRRGWKAQGRPPSADVRLLDAQRAVDAAAGTVAVVPTGGSSATGDWAGFAAELDPSAAPVPLPAPPDGDARVGQAPPGLAYPRAAGPPAPLMSYAGVPLDSVSRRTRLQQGPPPDCHPTGWTVPEGGWEDTGGPLIHLRLGRSNPQQVFGADWGLDWLLPPGGWAVEQLIMHDFRWEHFVAAALSPMGTGRLDGTSRRSLCLIGHR